VSSKSKFVIEVQALVEGLHNFEWELNKEFFEVFPTDVLESGKGKVHLQLNKTTALLQADFQIESILQLICDRSLDVFDYPINVTEKVFFKFGSEFREVADNSYIIPSGYYELDLKQFVFDAIALAIPPKRLHPRYQEELMKDEGLDAPFFSTSTLEGSEDTYAAIDPRWEKLKSLKK
jgi:uncharacterized metal-binding protein YceD (DUF177 family)